jgi:uncharacterized protein (TIGR02246 family)
MDIAALIDRYDAAWNGQDLDAIASMHATPSSSTTTRRASASDGAAAVREHIAAIFARWPTLRFERRALRVGDDFAVSEWTAHATHPDDGRELEWDGVDVFPIAADGRIAARTSTRRRARRAC